MGFLDAIGLGALKLLIVVASWTTLIMATIFIPFSFLITVPLMILLPIITTLLFVNRKKTVPEGCMMVDGKLECKASGI